MLSEIIFGQWLEKSIKWSTTSGLKRLAKLVSISAVASTRFIAPFYLKVWHSNADRPAKL